METLDARALVELLSAVPVFVALLDGSGRILHVNGDRGGRKERDWPGRPWEELLPPSVAEDGAPVLAAARGGEPGAFSWVEDQAAGPRHFEAHVSRVAGTVGGVCLAVTDLTPARRREDQLRLENGGLRLAVEATGIALWSTDLRTGQVEWDDRMREQSGLDTPLGFDEYVERLVHPDDRHRVRQVGGAAFSTTRFAHDIYRIVRPDREVRWILTTGRILQDEAGRAVRIVGGNLDITAQRALEEQLQHAQRLEAVGTLAAGIAHNFNNLLAVILPALTALRATVGPSERELVSDGLSAAERAADVVRQLMTFARPGTPTPVRPLEVSSLVERTLRFCRSTFDRRIVLLSRVQPGLVVQGDGTALEQVLINLLINARDAVSEHQEPVITLGAIDAPDPTGAHGLGLACLTVSDNGAGVPDGLRNKIFEPFFTTKGPRGTGLGLATARAIVQAHEGTLTCASAPGGGALFTVLLPRVAGASPPPPAPDAVPTLPPGLRVLVVDDEPAVRRITCRILERLGARTAVLEEGWTVAAHLAVDARFDVVLLDRSMPGPPTAQVVGQIRKAAPGAAVLLFTGDQPTDAELVMVDGIAQKPMSVRSLSDAIRAARGSVG